MSRAHFVGIAIVLMALPAYAAEQPRKLFNGKDLTGWDGNPKVWSVEEGVIVGRTTAESPLAENTFLIWRDGEPGDFLLRLKYRVVGGNSGVQYRSKVVDAGKWIVGGYQADIDSGPTYSGILYEERGRGILGPRGERTVVDADGKKKGERFADAAELQKSVRSEGWNDYVIEARGERLRHYLNGKLMSETTDSERDKRAQKGILALQAHRGPPMTVQFRDIELVTLDGNSPDYVPKATDGKE